MSGIWSSTTGSPGGSHVTLIHGSLDRSAGLSRLSRRLADRHLVTRYDRRGYGRSHPHDGPFDMDQQVEDLREVLGTVGDRTRRRILVGHSYGGNVALALAQRHPDLVDGVVTYETPLPWLEWWPGTSAGADAIAWRADPADAAERFMRRLISDARWERLAPSTRESRRREGETMVGELLDLRARPPWQAERIGVPVLAMHGELGHGHHRRAAETIAAEVPAGELSVLPGGRHPGPNTHPDLVAGLVGDFVERRVRPPTTA